MVFLAGCAASPRKAKEGAPLPAPAPVSPAAKEEKDAFAAAPELYRLKALQEERKGDLGEGLKHWEAVKAFAPEDAEAGAAIERVKARIASEADRRFRKGVALFQRQSYSEARKEFLLALYLNPDHPEALDYLKSKMSGEGTLAYEVKKGDTLKSIAQKIYKDPQKDFLVAYFNGLAEGAAIGPPMTLRVPLLEPPPVKKIFHRSKPVPEAPSEAGPQAKETVEKARIAYRERNYQEAALLAERTLEYDPAKKEYHDLVNEAFYEWGKQLSREGKNEEALKVFRRVDAGYKDAGRQVAHKRKEVAEGHYKNGVKFFIEEEIEKAIEEWESTLALDPHHPKAKKDIETGRNILQKLEKIK